MGFGFSNGQYLRICGHEFQVLGGVEFRSGGDTWQEYCLADVRSRQSFWLSIARADNEYAIYHSEYDKDNFTPQALKNAGYHEVDRGCADVIGVFGSVDVDIDDRVTYIEYEDHAEENIRSIEKWDDEVEFSSGYYLDWEEIEFDGRDSHNPGDAHQGHYYQSLNGYPSSHANGSGQTNPQANKIFKIILVVMLCLFALPFVIIILALLIIFIASIVGSSQSDTPSNLMSAHMVSHPKYQFERDVTSDLNDQESAKLYSSVYAVQEIVEDLITAVSKEYEPEVQPNGDGTSVTILTPDEYAIVYQGYSNPSVSQEKVDTENKDSANSDTENKDSAEVDTELQVDVPSVDDSKEAQKEEKKTYIQVSSRAYAYESSNKLLHASEDTDRHYRDFYYLRGYSSDRSRYSSRRHRYNDYRPILVYSPNNRYQSYAQKKRSEYRQVHSTRQSSTTNRAHRSSSSRRMGK